MSNEGLSFVTEGLVGFVFLGFLKTVSMGMVSFIAYVLHFGLAETESMEIDEFGRYLDISEKVPKALRRPEPLLIQSSPGGIFEISEEILKPKYRGHK